MGEGEEKMNGKNEMEHLKEEYQQIKVPEEALQHMKHGIEQAKKEKEQSKKKRIIRNWGIGMAAALTLVILPNSNEQIANAMEKLPIVGGFFEVITIREYQHEDGHNTANVKVPEITAADVSDEAANESVQTVNKSIEEYTNELIDQFKATMVEEGYSGLDVSYETVTNTDTWFTLAINAVETQASGYEFRRYYHIDKTTGEVATLEDIFQDDADYVSVISEEIKKQMKEQQDAGEGMYWLEEDEFTDAFEAIDTKQNFYFNDARELVIVFDEYEVAPGYMGCPEFVIPEAVIGGIKK